MSTLVVSRHAGAVAWLADQGYEGETLAHLSPERVAALRQGDTLIGVLPLPIILAAARAGATVGVLVMPDLPADQRGQELTADLMRQFGARVIWVEGIALDKMPGGPAGERPRTALTVRE